MEIHGNFYGNFRYVFKMAFFGLSGSYDYFKETQIYKTGLDSQNFKNKTNKFSKSNSTL